MRLLTWQSTLNTIVKNPFFGRGVGLDVANVVFENPNEMIYLGDAHQLWLSVAGQNGLFGFLGICLICFYILRKIFPLSLVNENLVLQTSLGIAFICGFLYQGLSGSFEDARYLWVLIGLLGSVTEIESCV